MTITENTENEQPVHYTYKDRVFRLLFKDKKRLLELYNALNNTAYTEVDDLTVNTLENAIFMKMKNDISFLIGCDMFLYEHQSTYCPNMPLRGLLYLTDLYKKQLLDIDLGIRKRIMLPTPHYIIFYNGTERCEEEFLQRLSDSFENDKEGCLELTVRTLNINYGHNKTLMEKCRPLADYSYFIAEIRKTLETMPMKQAVTIAVDTCIEKDILRDFLLEQKAEVIAMSIYEYNEEYVKKTLHDEGYNVGKSAGLTEGYDAGKSAGLTEGYDNGKSAGLTEGAVKGKSETIIANVESLIKNLGLDLPKACEGLDITVKEYEDAKKYI